MNHAMPAPPDVLPFDHPPITEPERKRLQRLPGNIGKVVKRIADVGVGAFFLFLIYIVLAVKLVTFQQLVEGPVFGVYSIVVTIYILSRFFLAYLHAPPTEQVGDLPTVSFVIPCKNEGEHVERAMLNLLAVGYPHHLMDLCVINDGSDDNSLEQMNSGAEITRVSDVETTVVDWEVNRGKREGMAEGIRRTRGEIVVFVDSDSFLERWSVHRMVARFSDPLVAATAGHARVHNKHVNLLTKMQNVRYYIAFSVYKAAEALFGSVTCCSGCCSAYRRSALEEVLEPWRTQTFLGVQCTYGDDRSLTNHLLRLGYKTHYVHDAMSSTIVPQTLDVFLRQQLRWKKSWVRESVIAASFIWKRNPIMAASFYTGLILPLVSPAVIFRSLVLIPFTMHRWPSAYFFGILVMAVIYGLYYLMHTSDRHWLAGLIFAALSTVFLVWQLPMAILTLRDGRWGTR